MEKCLKTLDWVKAFSLPSNSEWKQSVKSLFSLEVKSCLRGSWGTGRGAKLSAQSVEGNGKTAQARRQTAMKWGKSNSHNTGFKMICYRWVGSVCVCALLHSQLHLMTANSPSYCVWAMGWDFEGPHKSLAEFVLLAFKSLWRCIRNSLNHWRRLYRAHAGRTRQVFERTITFLISMKS